MRKRQSGQSSLWDFSATVSTRSEQERTIRAKKSRGNRLTAQPIANRCARTRGCRSLGTALISNDKYTSVRVLLLSFDCGEALREARLLSAGDGPAKLYDLPSTSDLFSTRLRAYLLLSSARINLLLVSIPLRFLFVDRFFSFIFFFSFSVFLHPQFNPFADSVRIGPFRLVARPPSSAQSARNLGKALNEQLLALH